MHMYNVVDYRRCSSFIRKGLLVHYTDNVVVGRAKCPKHGYYGMNRKGCPICVEEARQKLLSECCHPNGFDPVFRSDITEICNICGLVRFVEGYDPLKGVLGYPT